jgi:hypothetical protein
MYEWKWRKNIWRIHFGMTKYNGFKIFYWSRNTVKMLYG